MKKTKKFISLLLAVCVVVSTLPVFALPASAATAGAPKGDSTVFSALGIDTTATPDGYDAASTKNPYGKDRVTVSPVSELYVETALEHNSRAGALYGDGLASGKTSADFYEDGNSHIATAKGSFSVYRSVAGNFTGNGRNGQIATVAANESSGGVYLYFSDPKGMWDGRDKTLLQSGSALGNPSAGSLENFADAPYQLQNYMQIATGDFTGSGTDEIAVYVPEKGNSRVEIYQLTTTDQENSDWKDPDNWKLVWTYSLKEGNYVSNMVSLTAADMTGDGIDDLGITWGVYYGTTYNTTCKAVVLHGSKNNDFLQTYSTIDLRYGSAQTELVRAAMTVGDADGDGRDELVIGGQLKSDIDAFNINTRFLAMYEYNQDTGEFVGTASGNMKLIQKNNDGLLADGEDGKYFSAPICVANLVCVKQDGPGTQNDIYMDSVLYQQEGNGFSIEKELDENTSLQAPTGYNKYFAEYGAIAGDFTGDGKQTVVTMQYFVPYQSQYGEIFWWLPGQIMSSAVGTGFLRELDLSKGNQKDDPIALHSFSTGEELNLFFAAPDTDDDSVLLKYTGKHYLAYSDPTILAVLASPPYFSDLAHLEGGDSYIGNSETTYGVISSDSETNTKTSTISLGAYVSFEHDINFLGIHLGTIEAETEFTHGWTTETENTSTIAQTVEYGSIGGQDTVALYSIPMDVYVYNAYVPNGDGTYNEQTMTVNLPYNAVIKTLALSDYDAVAADYDALPQIGGTILTHMLGDPASYPKSTAGLTNVNLPAGDFASVGYGEGGYIKQSLELNSETSQGTSQSNAISVKMGAGVGDITVGVTTGYEAGAGTVTTSLDGKSFSGTIVSMPNQAKGYGYGYSWKIMEYTYDGIQNFPVVTYMVDDVTSPPKLPDNFEMNSQTTTDTSITLDWDSTDLSIAGFQIYRHYNFPDGSGDYPLGDVIPANGSQTSYSFMDKNLNPYTEYEYRIQAIGGSTPNESVLSDVLTARTKLSDGQPDISLTTSTGDTPLELYTDRNESITVTVTNGAAYAQDPLYQWQKKSDDGVWSNLEGDTGDTLTFSSAVSADTGDYRCRVNQIVGEYAISAYSPTVPVTFSKRDAGIDLSIDNSSGESTPVLTATLTNQNNSGSVPTGTVQFQISGNNYSKTYTENATAKDNVQSTAVCSNMTALPDGIYTVSVYYGGNLVFNPASKENQQYLTGVSSGYWLDQPDSIVYGQSISPQISKFTETGGKVTSASVTDGSDHVTLDYILYKAVNCSEDYSAIRNYFTVNYGDSNASTANGVKYFNFKNIYLNVNSPKNLWIPFDGTYAEIGKHYPALTAVNGTLTPKSAGKYKMEVTVKESGTAVTTLAKEFSVTKRPVTVTAPTATMAASSAVQPGSASLATAVTDGSGVDGDALVFGDTAYTLGLGVKCLDTGGTVKTLDASSKPGLYTTQVMAASNAAQKNYKFTFIQGLYTLTGETYQVTGTAAKLLDQDVGDVDVLSPAGYVKGSTQYQSGTQIIFAASPMAGYSVAGWTINSQPEISPSTLKNPNLLTVSMPSGSLNVSVRFAVTKNTLSFAGEHGSVECTSADLESGAIVIENAALDFKAVSDTGYHFSEWRLTSRETSYPEGGTDSDGNHTCTVTMPDTNCYLTAVFVRDSYELTLDDHLTASYLYDTDNNSSTPDELVTAVSGNSIPGDTKITVTPALGYVVSSDTSGDPAVTHYLWSMQPGGGSISGDGQSYTFTMTQPTKVGAQLKLQTFSVKYGITKATDEENTIIVTANGEPIALNPGDSVTLDGGTAIVITAKPAYGVIFDHWAAGTNNTALYTENDNVLTCSALTGNLDISAAFKPNESYTVSLQNSLHGEISAVLNGEQINVENGKLKVFKGDNVVVTASPDTDFMVGTWTVDGSIHQSTQKIWALENIDKNISVKVGFTSMAYYNVKFSAGEHGSVSAVMDDSVDLESGGDPPGGGSKITFTATPDSGYMVSCWTANGKTLQTPLSTSYVDHIYTIDSLSKKTEVTVNFEPISEHSVKINQPQDGSVDSVYNPDGFSDIRDGASAVFTVAPDDGYAVKSVSVNGTGIAKFDSVEKLENGSWVCTVNQVTADLEISAETAKLYSVTLYQATGGTASCGTAQTVAGTSITITAAASKNYTFSGWTATAEDDGVTVTLANPHAAKTTFLMPESNVTFRPAFTRNSGGSSDGESHNSGGSSFSSPSVSSDIIRNSATGIMVDLSGAGLPAQTGSVSLDVSSQAQADDTGDPFRLLLSSSVGIPIVGSPLLYNIRLLNQSGEAVSGFSGSAQVSLPVPAGQAGNYRVFWYDNVTGSLTDMGAVLANGYLTFSTTHFSYYALVNLEGGLVLDTTSRYVMNVGGNYSFLLKNPKPGVTYTVGSTDGSVLAVFLKNADCPDGRLYTVTGLKVGSAVVTICGSDKTAASFPVTVIGLGGSLRLDTLSYTMPLQGSYQIGVSVTGGIDTLLKVHSTSSSVAAVTRLANGNYQVKGRSTGIAYIMFDVYDRKNKLLAHASVRITVKKGTKPFGESRRQIAAFKS